MPKEYHTLLPTMLLADWPTRLFGRSASPWSVNSQIKISPDKRPLFRRTVTPTGHSSAPRYPVPSGLGGPLVFVCWKSFTDAAQKAPRGRAEIFRGKGRRKMGRGRMEDGGWRMGYPAPIAASFGGLLMMNARDGSEMVRNVEPKSAGAEFRF